MTRTEIREHVKSAVHEFPDGGSLTDIHNKVRRLLTRLQLRTLLGNMYAKSEISRERVIYKGKKITHYYPFNGKSPVVRKQQVKQQNTGRILSMKDFRTGGAYNPQLQA